MVYRYCLVPMCKNTAVSTPDKTFIKLPANKSKREMWLKAARRDPHDVSAKSNLHVCEDHFNLEVDMENYMEWKIMHVQKRMKKDVVPHKFDCQVDRKRSWNHPVLNVLNPIIHETIQGALHDRPSTSKAASPYEENVGEPTSSCESVETQLNLKRKFGSKPSQCNVPSATVCQSCSPIKEARLQYPE